MACDSGRSRLGARRRFCLVLVKPSHYDDDGYVIQWCARRFRRIRSPRSTASPRIAPSARPRRRRRHRHPRLRRNQYPHPPERLAAMIEAAGAGMVMLVGVQSNQCARDLARPLRAQRHPGRHRRLPRLRRALDARRRRRRSRPRQRMGMSLFAGEAEGRLDDGAARRRRRHAQAALQFHGRSAGHRGRADPAAAGRARAAHRSPAPPASTPAAAAPTSARSAPSSTCRAASRAAARRTTSSGSCG